MNCHHPYFQAIEHQIVGKGKLRPTVWQCGVCKARLVEESRLDSSEERVRAWANQARIDADMRFKAESRLDTYRLRRQRARELVIEADREGREITVPELRSHIFADYDGAELAGTTCTAPSQEGAGSAGSVSLADRLSIVRSFALDASKKASEPDYRNAMWHIVQLIDQTAAVEKQRKNSDGM